MFESPKWYKVNGKKIDILKESWDILVILDACRFDMFRVVYEESFPQESKLKKAVSPATYTMEFLNKVFTGYYDDVVYVSANPFISSCGRITYTDQNGLHTEKRSFDATNHFAKIINVYATGWNKKLNTVPPIQVNKAFHKNYIKNPDNRFIIHYLQPHRPFITLSDSKGSYNSSKTQETVFDRVSLLQDVVMRIFSESMRWKIKHLIGVPATSKLEKIFRKDGLDGIKAVYKNEIRNALKHIKMLINSISAKFLITSDHGELLGESWYGDHHGPRRRRQELIEVPWLEIEGGGIK